MNESMVDALARRLALPAGGSGTRRGVLRLLAGGGMAGLAGWLATSGADAKKPKKKRCKQSEQKCGKRCIPKAKCCKNADCLPGQVCQTNGKCGARSPGRLEAGDAMWIPCGAVHGNRHFEAYTIDWSGGPFVATMHASTFRAWVWVYEEPFFDPATPCSIDALNDQADAPNEFAQIFTSLPPGKYVVVATSAADPDVPDPATGRFGLEFGSP